MEYFNQFFADLPFYTALDTTTNKENDRLKIYLKHPSNVIFQNEINNWLEIAYTYSIADHYKQRLSHGHVDFFLLQSVLNELMVAYFCQTKLDFLIKEYNPSTGTGKYGEWIFKRDNAEIFVEVKSPWEEHKIGTFFYSHFDKLEDKIIKAHEQKPLERKPFLIFITDSLNISPIMNNDELLDVLYGKRKICLSGPRNGVLEYMGYNVVEEGFFRPNKRPGLSGVCVLNFMVWLNSNTLQDEGKYHFEIYHNPYCDAQCKLDIAYFQPYKQYFSHYNCK